MEKIIRGQWVDPSKLKKAKEFRSNMTEAETILWNHLRKNQLGCSHFRKQQVIDGFIADFYCSAAKLVIVFDGKIHDLQVENDQERDRLFESKGLKVMKIPNRDVLNNIDQVLAKILATCNGQI